MQKRQLGNKLPFDFMCVENKKFSSVISFRFALLLLKSGGITSTRCAEGNIPVTIHKKKIIGTECRLRRIRTEYRLSQPSECVNTSDCRVLKLPFHTKPKHEMVSGFNPLAISAQMRYNTCAFKTKHPNAVSRKFLT